MENGWLPLGDILADGKGQGERIIPALYFHKMVAGKKDKEQHRGEKRRNLSRPLYLRDEILRIQLNNPLLD